MTLFSNGWLVLPSGSGAELNICVRGVLLWLYESQKETGEMDALVLAAFTHAISLKMAKTMARILRSV